jgi:hypothetical protein
MYTEQKFVYQKEKEDSLAESMKMANLNLNRII